MSAPETVEAALQEWVAEALSRAPQMSAEQAATVGRLIFGPRPDGAVA